MVDEKLKEFILNGLKKRYSKESIKRALLNAGHQPGRIEEYFKLIEESPGRKPNILTLLLIFFIIVLIASILSLDFLYTGKTYDQRYDEIVSNSKELCTKGEYGAAFKNLQKALGFEATKNRASAFGVMGYCYIQQKKFAEAIPVLREAIKRYSKEPVYFYRLGVSYCNTNATSLGIANLKRSIDMIPANPDYYEGIVRCYLKSGNEGEAKKYLDELNEIKSKNNSTKQ